MGWGGEISVEKERNEDEKKNKEETEKKNEKTKIAIQKLLKSV